MVKKIKNGLTSFVIMSYFVGSVVYMLSYKVIGYIDFNPFLSCFFYFLVYGLFFYFAEISTQLMNCKIDRISISFFKMYVVFKFVFFSCLINSDMPTYISWLDSKIISLILSISILILTVIINIIYQNERGI